VTTTPITDHQRTIRVPAAPDAVFDAVTTAAGLTAELECIDMCTPGWNHYLASLRADVETGHGSPRGSGADQARRETDPTSD
jgi:hypothetical protein